MIIIGELINSTRAKVKLAIEAKDSLFIRMLTAMQVRAGVDFLDVNSAMSLKKEAEDFKWLLEVIQDETDLPLAIDTPNPDVMEYVVKLCKKPPLINSITNEGKRDRLIKIAKEHNASVIGLPLGSKKGVPNNPEDRMAEVRLLMEELDKAGIDRKQIYMDVLIMGIGSNPDGGRVAIDMIREIRKEFPDIKTIAGLSNISFGLPNRKLLNRVFLGMMMGAGLDGAILDPIDSNLMEVLKAAEAITGKDKYCRNYIKYMRGKKSDTGRA